MPPSTDCSAVSSCGGVRTNSDWLSDKGGPLGSQEYGELLSSHLRAPGDHRFAVRLDAGEAEVAGGQGHDSKKDIGAKRVVAASCGVHSDSDVMGLTLSR